MAARLNAICYERHELGTGCRGVAYLRVGRGELEGGSTDQLVPSEAIECGANEARRVNVVHSRKVLDGQCRLRRFGHDIGRGEV